MSGDKETKAARLREARKDRGYETAQAAAEAFGWGDAGYRHHENGTRGFGADAARRYAIAFGVSAGWLMNMPGIEKRKPARPEPEEAWLPVEGSVAAGSWRESYSVPADERKVYPVGPSPFPGARRFLLRVDGLSMNLRYEEGSILDCFSIFDLSHQPENGDDVVVERKREDGLREFTVKTFHRDDAGDLWLLPQSDQPEFQTPIFVGRPDRDHAEEAGIQIIALVLAPYPPRMLRLFDQYRKMKGLPETDL